ncbi:MAG: hypothetical protein Q9207_003792 [Kuettlingeria erythrocarpa]
MPAARTTRAREHSAQLSNRCPEASKAGRAFAQALAELGDDHAKPVLVKFLNDWIAAQGLQRRKSRLKTIELWAADQKKKKKKSAAAGAANKDKKAPAKPKKGNGRKPGDGGDDLNGGDPGDDGPGGDGPDGDGLDGGGPGGDGQDGGGPRTQNAVNGQDGNRAGPGPGPGPESGVNGQHGDGGSGTGEDNDGGSCTGGDDHGGSASGGDDNRSNDGGGENSGEADYRRVHGSQDGQEGTGHHDGRNDLPGEQMQENQPREDHVQNNRQSDRQGDGLTEQPHDRPQGEDDVLTGAQAVVQSSIQGGVNDPSDALSDNRHGHDQDNSQGDLPADESQHEQLRPECDSEGPRDEPEHIQQPNSQDLNFQDNIHPINTSPTNHSDRSGAQDDSASNSDHGSTIQGSRAPFQATVEDYDGSPIPENPANSSLSLAAGRYAKGGRQEHTRSSVLFQTPGKTRPPGAVQTPVVSVPQPSLSPSSPSYRDAQGLDSLLTATQLPDPLRLTARLPDKEVLCRTVRLLFAMPGNDQLSRPRQGDITSFVGSLFDKGSYWALRNNMLRYVERTGFRTESADGLDRDRQDSIASIASSRSPRIDSQSDSGLKAPPFLTMFAEQWRGFVQFSCQTSSTAAVRLRRMQHEEQCYLHWCTLKALWKASDPGRDHNSIHDNDNVEDSEDEEEGALPRTTAHLDSTNPAAVEGGSRALLQFLTDQMEQRKAELNLRRSPQNEAHTVGLLKILVAPFLGLTSTENLWRKTMLIGRCVHAIARGLGAGALVLVKRETALHSIRRLGPEMLERILPTISANHPELTQILQTIERVYLEPLRGPDPRLQSVDVGEFMRIDSMEQMWYNCGTNANGLDGILGAGAQPCDNEPTSAGRYDTTHPFGTSSNQSQADALADLDNDDEAIYNVRELLDLGPGRAYLPPAELPTPPPTAEISGGKRKTGPEREESPTKRLAHGRAG